MRIILPVVLLLAGVVPASAQDRGAVEAELERLRRELRIPGLSAAVVEGGTLVWVRHFGFKAAAGDPIRYPIASLTKTVAAVLALQLVERGALKLDAPLDGSARTLRHLLTHTSTGTPGQRFVYSSELFREIQRPLEKAAGQSFAAAVTGGVLRPAGMRHSSAPPRTTPATGLESTVEDLARFSMALDRGALLASRARLEMFRPPRGPTGQPLPYAHGWFVQYIGGEEVRWHFGQQAESSSLLVVLPRRRLTLAVLARTERLSAPFWLQLGDLRWSPVAAAWLTGWARVRIDLAEARRTMSAALIALHAGRAAEAPPLVARSLGLAPALGDAADGALLAAFARSGDAGLRETGRRIAKRLLAVDAAHPRTLLDVGVLELRGGEAAEGKRLLQRAVEGSRAPPEIEQIVREILEEGRRDVK